MPRYSYQCPDGHVTEELRTVRERGRPTKCPVCGARAKKAMHLDHAASTQQEYQRMIWSDAAGIHPDDIPEHRKLFPDIPVRPDGAIGFTSHHQRKKYLKAIGMFDRDGY